MSDDRAPEPTNPEKSVPLEGKPTATERTDALLKLKRIEAHPIKSIAVGGALVFGLAWTIFQAIHQRDFGELDRYRDLGGSPEQLRGRLDAKQAELCGVKRLRVSRKDFGRAQEFTCGETTFTFQVVADASDAIQEMCGSASIRFIEAADHSAFRFEIQARNAKGERDECSIPGSEAMTTEWMTTCGCPFLATPPRVDATGEFVELKAMFEAL